MEEKESLRSRPISFNFNDYYNGDAVFINLGNGKKVPVTKPKNPIKPKNSKMKEEGEYFVFEAVSIMKESRCKKYFEVSQEKNSRASLRTVSTIRGLIDTGASWSALDHLFSENNMSRLYELMKRIDISKESLDDLADKFESMIGDTEQFDKEYEAIMNEIENEL